MSKGDAQLVVKREITERIVSQFKCGKEDIQLEVLAHYQLQNFSRGSNPCIFNSGDDREQTFNVLHTVKSSRNDRENTCFEDTECITSGTNGENSVEANE